MPISHPKLWLLSHCVPFLALSSCVTLDFKKVTSPDDVALHEEPMPPQTFLENYQDLCKSAAYRQNIWINWNQGENNSQVALCVDLRNQVYLVVRGTPTERNLPDYYQDLLVSSSTLRERMDPQAFVLRDLSSPISGIFCVPRDPPEFFAADAINQVLGTQVSPEGLTFQAD